VALGSVTSSSKLAIYTIAKANSMENIKSTESIPDSCDDKNKSAQKVQSKH